MVGDRTVCIYGDTDICGIENIEFLTNVGNGWNKNSVQKLYNNLCFLISLRLLLANSTMAQDDLKYLLDAPLNLSEEDNIREFFDNCIGNNGWNLGNRLRTLEKKYRFLILRRYKEIQRNMDAN